MFIGSCNGMFRHLDARSGEVRWETNARGTSTRQYFFHGDVLVTADRVIAGADDSAEGADAGVHAFDRNSGRELWKYPAGRGVPGAMVGLGRRAFAYGATGDVIALDIESGKPLWTSPLTAPAWESPGASGGRLFVGSGDGTVYALHADTGRIEWRQNLGSPVSTSVRAAPGGVYVGTIDGRMHRLAAANGTVLSSLELDAMLKPRGVPVITADAVFVLLVDQSADHRALLSLDHQLSGVRWRQAAVGHWSTSRVLATRRTIVLGTPSGEIAAYCATDGSPAWTQKLADAPIRSIGGSDNTLYAGTPSGTLYAVRPPVSCQRAP